jgi:hypothetical protein
MHKMRLIRPTLALLVLSTGLLACNETVAKRNARAKRGSRSGGPTVSVKQIAEIKEKAPLYIGAELVAFMPGGRRWYSSRASEIFEWSGVRPRLKFNSYVRHHLAVSDDGRFLLADSTMLDLQGGKERVVRPTVKGLVGRRASYHLRAVAISGDRRHFVMSRQFRPPRLIRRRGRDGKTSYRPAGPTRPDGPRHFLALYDASTGRELAKLLDDKAGLVNQIAVHGRHVAVYDIRAKRIHVFDRLGQAPSRAVATLPFVSNMNARLGFSSDGRRLAAASLSGELAVWETRAWRRVARWSAGPKAAVEALDLHPKTYLLATGDRAGRLSIWRHGGGRDPKALYSKVLVSGSRVGGVHFSPNGKRLIADVPGATARVFIFEVATQ